jgi:hypothetical protein
VTVSTDPTIGVHLDEAEDLLHLLGRIEDWLRHCDSATVDDITHFFNGPGNGRIVVAGLISLLGSHSCTLQQRLKEAGQ